MSELVSELGDPRRIPVMIGGGQVNDRPASGAQGLDSLGLMIAAARAAGNEAGAGILERTDWLGVVHQLSFPDLSGTLVEGISNALAINPGFAEETPTPTGDGPVRLINDAANAIGMGEAQIALVIGAEALRTAAMRKAERSATEKEKTGPYPRRKPKVFEQRHEYGLNTPTDVYPMFENALRAALGQSLNEAQAESGRIWSNMSKVAAGNPSAWIQRAFTPEEIVEAGERNRPVAFPYTKLQVANAAVNQGAAIVVTSLAVAREAGVPDSRIIYVGKGAAAHEDDNPLMRADYAKSASMQVSITRALDENGLSVDDIDHFELYSCFPVIPKLARRVLGLPADHAMTVVGGLTFGGGPIGNYMTHAAACMVEKLREDGTNGLLFANGGYATHNHSIVLTKAPQPAGTFPHDFDFQAEADALRGDIPSLADGYLGAAKLDTYTVLFDREGMPKYAVVVARIDDTQRTIAMVPAAHEETIGRLLSGDPALLNASGSIERIDGSSIWSFD